MTPGKKDPPSIHYYDQDFVDIYDKSWAWIQDFWTKGPEGSPFTKPFFQYPGATSLNLYDTCMSSFFLVYSNNIYSPLATLDLFYSLQEEDGAIRGQYDTLTAKPIDEEGNPEGIHPPLLAWVEFNIYHKMGVKRRIKDVMPVLEKHYDWLESRFQEENGLYAVPLAATRMANVPREGAHYPLDFNAQMAMNALYISTLADILNDKDLAFRFKKRYFSLKTRINTLMWDPDTEFYHDLDKDGSRLKARTLAAYWTLLGRIPNEDQVQSLVKYLHDPQAFGTANPFPCLSVDDPAFDENGGGYHGSVLPPLTYMVIKGLEKYKFYEFARESAIKHLYYVLDTLHPEGREKGTLWAAYKPDREGAAQWEGHPEFNQEL